METMLIVIKDLLEQKLIVNDKFLQPLLEKYKVTIASPVCMDERYKAAILKEFGDIDFLDTWPRYDISIMDEFVYWLRNEFFFTINSFKSESCFQKAYLNLILPFGAIFEKDLRPFYEKFFSKHFNSTIGKFILKAIISPFYVLYNVLPLKKIIFSYKKSFTKKIDAAKFDQILFGRPDSAVNIYIYNTYSHAETKVTTLCRNFDTPALRGVFAVPSDYTIVFDKALARHLMNVNNMTNFGKIVLYDHPIKSYKANERQGDEIPKILYATSAPSLLPSEPETIMKIHDFLEKKYKENFQLFLRLIYADSPQRYENLLSKKNVYLEKQYLSSFDSHYNRKLEFPTPEETREFYDRLQRFDLLLSSGSTINYEAYLLNIKTAYCNFYDNTKWLFRRDHLRILSEELGIATLSHVDELGQLLVN